MQPAYAHLSSPDRCPVARDMAAKVISLPMGPYLSAESAQTVADTLLAAAGVALPGGTGSGMDKQATGAAAAAPVLP
jgi:UDP-2-acetamido-2-deoxy-ribo-hexuluronate aminotransferase